MGVERRERRMDVTAAQRRLRRQWAEVTLGQHHDTGGSCAVCTGGEKAAAWPCLPAKTALIYLGGVRPSQASG